MLVFLCQFLSFLAIITTQGWVLIKPVFLASCNLLLTVPIGTSGVVLFVIYVLLVSISGCSHVMGVNYFSTVKGHR